MFQSGEGCEGERNVTWAPAVTFPGSIFHMKGFCQPRKGPGVSVWCLQVFGTEHWTKAAASDLHWENWGRLEGLGSKLPWSSLQFGSYLESDLIAVTSVEQCTFIGLKWGVAFYFSCFVCPFFRTVAKIKFIFSHLLKFWEEFAMASIVNLSEIYPHLSVRHYKMKRWLLGIGFWSSFSPKNSLGLSHLTYFGFLSVNQSPHLPDSVQFLLLLFKGWNFTSVWEHLFWIAHSVAVWIACGWEQNQRKPEFLPLAIPMAQKKGKNLQSLPDQIKQSPFKGFKSSLFVLPLVWLGLGLH